MRRPPRRSADLQSAVAQTCSLPGLPSERVVVSSGVSGPPLRRGWARAFGNSSLPSILQSRPVREHCRLQVCDTADYKSALRCRGVFTAVRFLVFAIAIVLGCGLALQTRANDLEDAREQFDSGNYNGCIETVQKGLKEGFGGQERHLLLTKALLTVGKYAEALNAVEAGLRQESSSIRLRWLAREVYFSNGQPDKAKEMADEIVQRVASNPRAYREPPELVVFAQAALLRSADPKKVLDQILGTAQKADPKYAETYLVSGNLALDKHDYALAAKKFEAGLKEAPDDLELKFGLARAYEPSDSAAMIQSLEAVLEKNSNHVGSLLLLVDHAIDAEDYPMATKLLEQIGAINPSHPDAWAYRAVVAHLQNESEAEKEARDKALKFWASNPRVDYLIGLKLAQNYRFAEGAEHQKKALEFDPDYLPAKGQLAHDYLRLGEESQGWDLASDVYKQDGYDAEAFNVMNLRDTMSKFTTLSNGDFIVRMGSHEAAVYGSRAVDLLERARSNLCAKYEFQVKRPTIVEIFPDQKDFAVRTFGMPGNPGYLGVCFGNVVTANSPASHPNHLINWEAVLWHEFCHVVTLQLTKNKMPRWLSEGISVYEELQANPSWGQRMTPRYREMVLGDELTPISKLSGAFLAPESEVHLQFAYYESSQAVEFLVQRFGMDKLKATLKNLGEGMEINAAIAKNTEPMDKLEPEFAAFMKEKAENLAPGLDFEKPAVERQVAQQRQQRRGGRRGMRLPRLLDTGTNAPTNAPDDSKETNEVVLTPAPKPGGDPPLHEPPTLVVTNKSVPPQSELALNPPTAAGAESFDDWVKSHPTNFWAMTYQAEKFVEDKEWAKARPILEKLVQLYPDSTGGDSAYPLLAATYRSLGETNLEKQLLAKYAAIDDEAAETYLRLLELDQSDANWKELEQNAQRYLAVNPLTSSPYRYLLTASEKTGDVHQGISACRALLELDPPDPAETHYQFAKLLHQTGDPAARRQVLMALEEAPRYRAAQRLLLEINASPPSGAATPTNSPPSPVR
jgi:tetratricopeptide (TPR) repeat protein